MAMEVSRLNTLYWNAARSLEISGSWVMRAYESPNGKILADALSMCLQYPDVWRETNLSELRTMLAISRTYLRSLFSGNSGEVFWDAHTKKFQSELDAVRDYIPLELVALVENVINLCTQHGVELTDEHTYHIQQMVSRVEGRVLVVPERPRLGHIAQSWITTSSMSERMQVLTNMGDIRARLFDDYDLVLFPGSPSHYLNRPSFDIYFRALLLSGLSSSVFFVSPAWAVYKSDLEFTQKLLPGLGVKGLPKILSEIDPKVPLPVGELELNLEMEDFGYVRSQSEFVSFESGGDRPCKFIYLGENRAYPVEEDAKRISVFERNEHTGEWNIVSKHPFTELVVGDILVASKDRSEMQANRDRAAIAMGELYWEFSTGQANWKAKLFKNSLVLGLSKLESELEARGILKFNRARHWWSEDFIQPAVQADFKLLLEYLNFSADETTRIMHLAKLYDGHLIKSGKGAALAISKVLGEDEYIDLESGREVEVILDDFGDASYLLVPTVGISDMEILTKPSQIRQVIQLSEGVEN